MFLPLIRPRSTRRPVRRRLPGALILLALGCAPSAFAQKVTTVEDLTLQQAFVQLANPLGSGPVGEALGLTTALEIATAPFSTSSGGFLVKLNPSTGLLDRTTTTFGPSFSDRALTSGEGQVNVGATFSSTTYDKISDFSLANFQLGSTVTGTAATTRTGLASLQLTSKTVAMSATVGVTDDLDVGVIVPLVSTHLAGSSSLIRGDGVVARLAETDGIYSGLGDVVALAKYRFIKFHGEGFADPGGVAVVMNMRLPTGDRANLRGLGVTRTQLSGVVSAGTGWIRPHGSVGFEYWDKGIGLNSGSASGVSVEVRHQVRYTAGVELEATSKVTLLVDFLGQQIMGGGQVGFLDAPAPAGVTGVTASQSLVALSEGIRKALLVPGLKVNLKGKMLLSLNALITLDNNGLHPKVTPVVGINLTK